VGPEFGRDFQSTFFEDWLRWTGITDITAIRHHPTLTGDAGASLERAVARARALATAGQVAAAA
jgi:FMN-dependent NADH-azoreductase